MSKRDNERQVLFWMDKELHKKIRLECVELDTNVKEYICKVLEDHFKSKKR